MAKSSSSSRSSKSSKSMGIDLTMVLLAVLVGLLVCSLMNNKPLIEGLNDGDTVPDLARQSECKQANGDLMCRRAGSNSRSPADAFVAPSYNPGTFGGSMAVCNQPGKTELWCHIPGTPHSSPPPNTGTDGGSTTINDIEKGAGKCVGRVSNQQTELCSKYDGNKDQCNNDSGGVCSFKESNSIYSYSGGLEGSVWYEWMEAIGAIDKSGNVRPGVLPNNADGSKATSISTDGQAVKRFRLNRDPAFPTSSKANNFLEVIDVVKDSTTKDNASADTSKNITDSKKIPESLKDTVKAYVDDCIDGWEADDTTKEIYGYNGGKPIMQYSLQEGLKCLNPYYQPVTEPGTVPRLFRGKKGCPSPSSGPNGNAHYVHSAGKGCSTFDTPVCNWPDSETYFESVGQATWNNTPFTESGACGLPVCAGQNPGQCLKVQTKDTLYDASEWASGGIHNLFKRT